MEIYVRDNKLRAAIEDERVCRKQYGADMAKKIKMRVDTLRAAETLSVFWPPLSGPERCHELKADLAGTFSMDVKQPYRLLFRPLEEDNQSSNDEKDRWSRIKAVEILRIEDTHG
jgi:plasmid maintenance system killer protein